MAKVTKNLLVKGASGKLGDQFVYKQRGDDTFITRLPEVDKDAEPTENQVRVRDRFGEASLFAQGANANPELKAEYERNLPSGKTAFNAAFRDYLKAPVVISIDVSKYAGLPGSPIVVKAKDDFRIAEVSISIRTATGELVEVGNAVLNPINRNKWTYTTVEDNPAYAGGSVSATARDIPGNEGRMDITL
ncbi:hypothetical protein [Flavihumibacter solisilvae]|uniref:hypothetical protein n=1 Tax=Flavihumibacter solisilvae TaxID=1349421 RepID=UPI000689A9BB|nr:hypothetical protein [Flavihumibacter solisilvae]